MLVLLIHTLWLAFAAFMAWCWCMEIRDQRRRRRPRELRDLELLQKERRQLERELSRLAEDLAETRRREDALRLALPASPPEGDGREPCAP